MTLYDLGFNDSLEKFRREQHLDSFETGRVIAEHKERYVVKTVSHEYDCELIGNLRFTAESRYDLPAVGDWVAISPYDEAKALIHAIFPRTSILERQEVGKYGQIQIIAANIDYGLIIQAVDRDFNVNRLERYLTICNASQVEPIIVLSKIDLISAPELETRIQQIRERIKNVTLMSLSNQTGMGHDALKSFIKAGKSYCLLGSSGVGKSTLLNMLSGTAHMKTSEISASLNKGKHTTSHRELMVLPGGGIFIDNPGMREVGIADTAGGLEITFETIIEMSKQCRFKDCTHVHEKGCAILEALEKEEIDKDAYHNFQKMGKEKTYFESSLSEKKKKDKDFGKMVKTVNKQRKKYKF